MRTVQGRYWLGVTSVDRAQYPVAGYVSWGMNPPCAWRYACAVTERGGARQPPPPDLSRTPTVSMLHGWDLPQICQPAGGTRAEFVVCLTLASVGPRDWVRGRAVTQVRPQLHILGVLMLDERQRLVWAPHGGASRSVRGRGMDGDGTGHVGRPHEGKGDLSRERYGPRLRPAHAARRVNEGRGQGEGSGYRPWMLSQDYVSARRAARRSGIPTAREHPTCSEAEANSVSVLMLCVPVPDIREQ